MPSHLELHAVTAADIVAVAQALCDARVTRVGSCRGGGNNRVYRVDTAGSPYALKCYGPIDADGRDRLRNEYDGLRFLHAAGVGSLLPRTIAVDRVARCALYEWIDGTSLADYSATDIRILLELMAALHAARNAEGAMLLPIATEAVLRTSDICAQIRMRISRLETVVENEPDLAAFLFDDLEPEFQRWRKPLSDYAADVELEIDSRTLSPSDLGFHNALRRADGSLTFLDLEYFGWDDPVKLVADFLWHPAMTLSADARQAFLVGARDLYGATVGFQRRLERLFPLYGIRWVLIILNEFVPALWERRSFSGQYRDWAATKHAQLLKARATLAAVRAHTQGVF